MTQGFRQLILVTDKAWIPDPHCAWERARCFISLEGCHTALGTWLRFLYKTWTPASLPHQWRRLLFSHLRRLIHRACHVTQLWQCGYSLTPWLCWGRGWYCRLKVGVGIWHTVLLLCPDSWLCQRRGSASRVLQFKGSTDQGSMILTESLRSGFDRFLVLCTVCDKTREPKHRPWCLLLEFAPLNTIIPVYLCVLLGHLQSTSLETSSLARR